MPRFESRLVYADHINGRGYDFFQAVCDRDLEGIVGKWRTGRYSTDGTITSWVKIKNPNYSQMVGRQRSRRGWRTPNCG